MWLESVHSEKDVTSHTPGNDFKAPGNNFKAPGNDYKAAVLPNCVTAKECIHEITMACSFWFQSLHGDINMVLNNFNGWLTDNHIHEHFGHLRDIIAEAVTINFINTTFVISHIFNNQSKRKRSKEEWKDSSWHSG